MVTVYSKQDCQGCRMTKRKLDDLGVAYTVRDVEVDPDALGQVVALGYSGLPVVHTSAGEHWQGYRPDKLQALA